MSGGGAIWRSVILTDESSINLDWRDTIQIESILKNAMRTAWHQTTIRGVQKKKGRRI